MTGDSDNEIGEPGQPPVPADLPPSEGEPSYRPLRGWASGYGAEPTLWSRVSSGIERFFSKKPASDANNPSEIEQVADAARELEEEPEPAESEDENDSEPAAPDPLPVVRDYQLRGDAVPDMPVVRDYQFHSAGDDEGPRPPDDRPSLDDALPMESGPAPATPAAEPVVETPPVRRPSPSWTPVIPPPHEEAQPGFFSRLFGRKSKSQPVEPEPTFASHEPEPEMPREVPEVVADADWSAPQADAGALEAAEQALTSFAEQTVDASDESFASVDDALPPSEDAAFGDDTLEVTDAVSAPADEVQVLEDLETVELVAKDFSRFAPPTPPAKPAPPTDPFATTLPTEADDSFDTLQMVPVVPPADVTEGRSTLEMQAIEDADTDRGSMVLPVPPEVTAAQEAERPPFFVPKFRSFYNEIVSHKHQKAEFTAGFATAVMDYSADLTPDAAAAALSKRLREILEVQAAEATWMGGEAAKRFPDAQYAMAALADEVFTYLDWPGRDGWHRHLIEQQLFRSNAKDVEFFKRVDRLLKNEAENPTPAAKDLARMYLLVLAAGFQGKYRPFGLSRPLAEYRRRLYEFISQKDPLLLYGEQRKLFPDAAEHVVVGRAVSRFSMLQQWAAVLAILLLGYTVISQVAWNRVSADLKDVTARVEAANSTSNSDGVAGDPR